MKATVRIFVPKNNDWIGHYDLQISGTVKVNSVNRKNYIYSYGPRRKPDGSKEIKSVDGEDKTVASVYMYTDSMTKTILKEAAAGASCELYTISFNITNDDIKRFQKNINMYVGGKVYTSLHQYNVSGPFEYYSYKYANCFKATAYWCNWLNNPMLMKIYNKYKTKYQKYMPTALKKTYEDSWQHVCDYERNADGSFRKIAV